jgi:hypothetical protein
MRMRRNFTWQKLFWLSTFCTSVAL